MDRRASRAFGNRNRVVAHAHTKSLSISLMLKMVEPTSSGSTSVASLNTLIFKENKGKARCRAERPKCRKEQKMYLLQGSDK